ncbi:MAG: hypothetical protein Q8P18_29165 [Pseudomonadota bacterium]|nr:hypothetical protein [Pseudomonadota bacterium]
MPTVGLICEGPTDRAVLERILDGFSAGRVTVAPIQPPHPMRPGVDFGGWNQVFASIRRKDVSGALAFNDLDNKHLRAYEDAARGLRRRPAVDALRNRAPSLDAFLTALDEKLAPLLA